MFKKIRNRKGQFVKGYCPDTCFKKGHIPSVKAIELSILTNKGNQYAKGYKHTADTKKRIANKLKGEKHYRYKKDRTTLQKQNRRGDPLYFEWRKQVWLRDNFKCKIANPDCRGRMEAHHILGWMSYPELRYQTNNGITLCHAHHPRKRVEEAKLSPYFQKLVSKME